MSANHTGRVLIIDHDPNATAERRVAFELDGFDVSTCLDGDAGLCAVRSGSYDLVVLDPSVPGLAGFELVRSVLEVHRGGVMIHGAVDDRGARIRCLELGADDVVPKSLPSDELLARARAILRRMARCAASEPLRAGDVVVDVDARRVHVRGIEVEFTPKEFDLLVFLMLRPGRVFTRHQLLVGVWNSASYWQGENTVTEHVRRIRLKTERDPSTPRMLLTVRRVGYRLERRTGLETPHASPAVLSGRR